MAPQPWLTVSQVERALVQAPDPSGGPGRAPGRDSADPGPEEER